MFVVLTGAALLVRVNVGLIEWSKIRKFIKVMYCHHGCFKVLLMWHTKEYDKDGGKCYTAKLGIKEQKLPQLLYVEDTTLQVESGRKSGSMITGFGDVCKRRMLKVNVGKCQTPMF